MATLQPLKVGLEGDHDMHAQVRQQVSNEAGTNAKLVWPKLRLILVPSPSPHAAIVTLVTQYTHAQNARIVICMRKLASFPG